MSTAILVVRAKSVGLYVGARTGWTACRSRARSKMLADARDDQRGKDICEEAALTRRRGKAS